MNNNLDKLQSVPLVSVLMPVYNGEKYLRETIDSILGQTFTDFEFIIINDGSSDSTEEIIRCYDDRRICYYRNDRNIGIVETLNKGLEICKGKYIARIDADDNSRPQRFEKQVAYLEQHPEVVACGCLYDICDAPHLGVVDVATQADDVRYDMALFCQCCHSAMMIRNKALQFHGLKYLHDYQYAEDYKLWTQLLKYGDIVNLPEVLHSYRLSEGGISNSHTAEQKKKSNQVRKDYLFQMGINVEHTLNEAAQGTLQTEQLTNILINYYPLIMRCRPQNWLKKNYISLLKKYAHSQTFLSKIRLVSKFGKVLSSKDKIVLLLK